MCDKNIKRLVALLLAFFIIWMQIVYDTTTVKAVGSVATASALWEALTAASGAYAGYSLTNKQNKTVTQQLASYLSDFADTLMDAPWDHLSSVSDFTSWMVSEIVPQNGLLTKDSAYLLTKAFCDQAGNTVDGIKKHAVVLEKNVKKIETAKPTNPKDDDDGGLLPALLKEIALNIAADGAINAGKKFIKFCGTLTDLIIKDNLNAEYIKGKGKWDWASLGFKTDYDTVTISSSDGSKFAGVNANCGAATNGFDYRNTLLYIDDGTYKHVVHIPAGTEKTAIVTIHNPDDDIWITALYPEDAIYKQMVDVKAGNLTCSDLFEWVNDNYYSAFDTALKVSFDFHELIKTNNLWHQGKVFESILFNRQKSYGSPLHISLTKDFPDPGTALDLFMTKSNTTAYNLGVTANIYFINFTSQTKYTGATTALNGTETMQPTVKPSKYTNTADEIDKQSDTITINNYVINNYSNTDNVINNIANDNDLTLDSKDDDDSGTSSDYTSLLKSILSVLRNIPKNTYKYFNNKLDMIITAIQSGNSEDVVNVITQLNNPMDRMINQLNNIDNTLFDFKSTGLSLKNVSVDLDVNNFALSVATEINTVLVNVFVPSDDYFDTKFTVVNNQLKNKLGYDGYIQLIDDIKEIKEAKPSNIVINTSNFFGSSEKESSDLAEASGDSTVVIPDVPPDESDGKIKITLVNFNTYYKYKDTIDAWVRGFVFIALLIFNIRHVYLNVRGHDIGVNTVDTRNL